MEKLLLANIKESSNLLLGVKKAPEIRLHYRYSQSRGPKLYLVQKPLPNRILRREREREAGLFVGAGGSVADPNDF